MKEVSSRFMGVRKQRHNRATNNKFWLTLPKNMLFVPQISRFPAKNLQNCTQDVPNRLRQLALPIRCRMNAVSLIERRNTRDALK